MKPKIKLSKVKQDRLMVWTETAWKNGWVNKKHWFGAEEIYASIYSYLTHKLGTVHKK